MAGGDDHQGANKREHEAAGRPKRAKRKKPSEDPAAGGGAGAKGKPQPVTAKDKRVSAKEMSESRKPDYNLEKELTVLWVKMRGHDVSTEDIIKLVTEAICKMDGKYLGISGSHVNASFLQTCVKWCSQLENGTVRRHIIRMLKKLIKKLAVSDYGCLVVFEELTKQLKELIFDKTGRRQLLQLLYTLCSRYLTPTDLICLNYNVPSLISTDEASGSATEVNLDDVADEEHGGSEDTLVASDSKKDPMKWRRELSVKSELCEALIETCIEHVGDLLQTNCLRGVLYEVISLVHALRFYLYLYGNVLGGVTDRIRVLHNAIASDAARLRTDDVEHAFDNRHSSRIIRRMILDCPAFAATLWKKALEGKCKLYAHGICSSTVVTAYLESPDSRVKDLAKSELQPLIDGGILKKPRP